METRRLGRSSVEVSRIGFGCGPTAGLMTNGDEALQVEAVRRALDLGVTYFDTAPVYGAGASERALGAAISRLGVNPTIASKVALEWDDLDDIPGAVRRSIEGSLERLRQTSIDVLHIHNRVGTARAPKAEYGSGALLTLEDMLGANGILDALQPYHRAGQIRAMGGCAYGGDPALVRALIDDGRLESMLVNYSLLNTSAWEGHDRERDYDGVGAYAETRGLGVIALRALEAGRLTRIPEGSATGDPLDGLSFLSSGGDPIAKAIRYALGNSGISSLLIGFSSIEQIEYAAAAEAQGPLDPALQDQIDRWRAARL